MVKRVVGLAVIGGALMVAPAMAQLTSDTPAGLVVYPKLRIDTLNQDETGDVVEDTIIQLSNTSNEQIRVRCYLVNANAHCSNDPDDICQENGECGSGAFCVPGWTETDFRFTLTKNQPIVWWLSEGMPRFPIDGLTRITQDGQFNEDSNIPPAPETPFQGELKCFQVDEGDNPVARNDLKGEATIVRVSAALDPNDTGNFDARKYNAVGFPSREFNDGNDTLCLGGNGSDECPEPEYDGCPNVWILDHFFDYAVDPALEIPAQITTDVTFVPCSQNFLNQTTFKTTVQFLVFNEFEQRLSTSIRVECFEEIQLANIDTRSTSADDFASIFSVEVQGTLTGQTRMRAVQTDELNLGHGIVVVAEEFHNGGLRALMYDGAGGGGTSNSVSLTRTAAFNLQHAGIRDQGDIVRAPRE